MSDGDLESAWLLTAEQATGTGELAQLLLGANGPAQRDAVLVAVAWTAESFRIERGQVLRCDAAERQARARLRARAAEAESEARPWLAHLDAVRSGAVRPPPTWSGRLQTWLLPGHGEDPAVDVLLQRRGRAGAPERAAAEILRELGAWDAHDDLELWRSGLLAPAPSSVWQPATGLPPRHLPLVTIDNDDPSEVDDALCCERQGEGWRLWVAIAHPVAALSDEVDAYACRRGATLYHPREVAPMLPSALAAAHSLAVGQPRPALLFRLDLNAQGELAAGEVQLAEVCIERAWSYDALTAAWRAGDPVLGAARDALLAAE